MAEQLVERSRRSWFGRGRTRALLAVGLLVGTGATVTSAYWTSEGTVVPGSVTAGALHIDLDGRQQVKPENAVAWSGLDLTGIPASGSRAAILNVRNNSVGPVSLTYRITGSATNPGALGGNLTVTIRRAGQLSGQQCTNGTVVAGPVAINALSVAASPVLAPNASHDLCIQVTRSATALTTGATSDVTFTFPATQVQP
ncbi:SipW-dependent-type signal peptide-containing protein [Nocardioides caeni]|uniref:Ribosomally synthesized peptide with SipW-like signal peptide n=1 Tax=Nocardioides caeni TaxID=574700 RepID=A0A4V4HK70_9ACTN|nr:SipW-dependent-type signal peptide-containing protein [Nocardioides caeni]THV13356.1 hypothetical protein E9934_10360 [Nocardioides caeni]